MGGPDRRYSLQTMKPSPYNPGTGGTAAHRHGLDTEPARGSSTEPGLSKGGSQQGSRADGDATGSEVFEDLRRRNERRARFARPQRAIARAGRR
jgi:hypothetical protein